MKRRLAPNVGNFPSGINLFIRPLYRYSFGFSTVFLAEMIL